MRVTTVAVALCLSVLGLAASPNVDASIRKPTNIPAQALGTALRALEKDRNLQVIFVSEDVRNVLTQGAVGEFTSDEALKQLLKGTGLTFRYLDEKTVTIVPLSSSSTTDTSGAGPATPSVQPPTSTGEDTNKEEGKRGFLDRFRVAQLDQGTSSSSSSVEKNTDQASQKKPEQLEEVIVTAQKHGEERLQDVPIPISVLNADTLADNGQTLLRDYYASVPSLSVNPSELGQQQIAIRGITAGNDASPVVGVLIDDVPYGATVSSGLSFSVPDIDPGDLARVEVLRGPQGTLYGSDSMGGLIKFVTRDPTTDSYSGRIEAGTSYVYNGDEPGYNFRASANIPVSDTFAIRVSGFTRQDPGYVDNILSGQNGINEVEADGGRLSALWRPWDGFSLKLSALYQYTKGDGSPEAQPSLGDLQQNLLPGTGWFDRTVQAYSATVNYKLGAVDLTSVTGYNSLSYRDAQDLSDYFGSLVPLYFPVTGSPFYDDNHVRKVTQEFRLSAPLSQSIDSLFGVFFTHETTAGSDVIIGAANATTGAIAGQVAYLPGPTTFDEYAAFADLTFHVTSRIDVQVGGRDSRYKNENDTSTSSGFLYGPTTLPETPIVGFSTSPAVSTTKGAFTYLLTPSFKISSDLMVYARVASGYRPGQPNTPGPGVPYAQSDPDKTQNYEIGVKGDFLNKVLSLDASLYYIDWENIQLQLHAPNGFGYDGNGSGAKSEGVELSVTAKPLTGLTAAAWLAYDEAVLTKPFPPATSNVYGAPGDRLPNSPRFSGNLSLEQGFPVTNGTTGFAGAQVSYVGDRLGYFTGTPGVPAPRQYYSPYTKTDLRAGLTHETWTTSIYVNNVADSRGVISGGLGYYIPNAFFYIQPRTIGVTVSKQF